MNRFFFEDTLALPLAVAVGVIVLGAVWYLRRTRQATVALGAGVALGIALLFVQKIVVTDREAIERTVRRLAVAVQEQAVATLEASVDDTFSSGAFDRERFVAVARATLERLRIDILRLHDLSIDVHGDWGDVEFAVVCRIRINEFDRPSTSRWKLAFVRREADWKLTLAEPIEVDGQSVPGLDGVLQR